VGKNSFSRFRSVSASSIIPAVWILKPNSETSVQIHVLVWECLEKRKIGITEQAKLLASWLANETKNCVGTSDLHV